MTHKDENLKQENKIVKISFLSKRKDMMKTFLSERITITGKNISKYKDTIETFGHLATVAVVILIAFQSYSIEKQVKVAQKQVDVAIAQVEKTQNQVDVAKEQVAATHDQIKLAAIESHEARRAQLVATIYNLKDGCTEKILCKCEPKASARARAEAAISLVGIDSANGHFKTDLRSANFQGAIFSNGLLDGAIFHGTNLSNVRMEGTSLVKADLRSYSLSGLYLDGANLRRANLSGSDLSETVIKNANLNGADLTFAKFYKIVDGKSNETLIMDSTFVVADLRGAQLQNAKILKADFSGALLQGANLRGIKREGVTFQNAKYSKTTKWPAGFDPQAAGAILVEEKDGIVPSGTELGQ